MTKTKDEAPSTIVLAIGKARCELALDGVMSDSDADQEELVYMGEFKVGPTTFELTLDVGADYHATLTCDLVEDAEVTGRGKTADIAVKRAMSKCVRALDKLRKQFDVVIGIVTDDVS